MSLVNLSDEEIMGLLKKGDGDALLILYNRHSSKVWSYIRKRVPVDTAEDLYQDCFVKVVERRESWNGQPFVLWLYVVARNIVSDYYRSKKVESRYLEKHTSGVKNTDPSNVVDDILSSLPSDKAKLLKEFFDEGWSYQELADKYKLSEVTLRKRLSRAIKMLKGGHDGK